MKWSFTDARRDRVPLDDCIAAHGDLDADFARRFMDCLKRLGILKGDERDPARDEPDGPLILRLGEGRPAFVMAARASLATVPSLGHHILVHGSMSISGLRMREVLVSGEERPVALVPVGVNATGLRVAIAPPRCRDISPDVAVAALRCRPVEEALRASHLASPS